MQEDANAPQKFVICIFYAIVDKSQSYNILNLDSFMATSYMATDAIVFATIIGVFSLTSM